MDIRYSRLTIGIVETSDGNSVRASGTIKTWSSSECYRVTYVGRGEALIVARMHRQRMMNCPCGAFLVVVVVVVAGAPYSGFLRLPSGESVPCRTYEADAADFLA